MSSFHELQAIPLFTLFISGSFSYSPAHDPPGSPCISVQRQPKSLAGPGLKPASPFQGKDQNTASEPDSVFSVYKHVLISNSKPKPRRHLDRKLLPNLDFVSVRLPVHPLPSRAKLSSASAGQEQGARRRAGVTRLHRMHLPVLEKRVVALL